MRMPSPPAWQKSSFSADGNNCLELAHWQRTPYGSAGNSLESAENPATTILLRESDDPDTIIATSPTRLRGLLALARKLRH